MKKLEQETTLNSVEQYRKRMVSIVNKIKIGSIIGKIICGRAHYFKVKDIIECTSNDDPNQLRTLALEYVGDYRCVRDNAKIVFYEDIAQFVRIKTDYSEN